MTKKHKDYTMEVFGEDVVEVSEDPYRLSIDGQSLDPWMLTWQSFLTPDGFVQYIFMREPFIITRPDDIEITGLPGDALVKKKDVLSCYTKEKFKEEYGGYYG